MSRGRRLRRFSVLRNIHSSRVSAAVSLTAEPLPGQENDGRPVGGRRRLMSLTWPSSLCLSVDNLLPSASHEPSHLFARNEQPSPPSRAQPSRGKAALPNPAPDGERHAVYLARELLDGHVVPARLNKHQPNAVKLGVEAVKKGHHFLELGRLMV
jgi:hypothetical protein